MRTSANVLKRALRMVRHLPFHPQWLLGQRRVAPAVRTLEGIVLDVGCADRWIEPWLSSAATYIGVDYPATGATLYAAKADVFADASALPFASQSVDAIICLEVLEHVRNHRAALQEFFRVLKPGGRLIVSVPFMYPIHDAPHDYQRLTSHGIERDMEEVGLKIVRLDKTGHSVRAAGVLFSLAIVGGLYSRGRLVDYVRMPFAALGVPVVNLVALGLSYCLPDWEALGSGFEVDAIKEWPSPGYFGKAEAD